MPSIINLGVCRLPRDARSSSPSRNAATVAHSSRCSRESSARSSRHARSSDAAFFGEAVDFCREEWGRTNQLRPSYASLCAFSPSNLRRTAYFQYAACNAISQMLWRPAPGRAAAARCVIPRNAPRSEGPCHAGPAKPSSSDSSRSATCDFAIKNPREPNGDPAFQIDGQGAHCVAFINL